MRIRLTILALAFVMILGTAAAAAPEKDREVDRMREQIHRLLREADELRAAGKPEAARELVQKAERMERKLAEHLAPDRQREFNEAELKKILMGLEHGIGSLEALGKNDLADGVRRVAEHVRERLEQHHREKPVDREREAARKQIEIMRMSMKAFLEKDEHDAADRVEHAIHALELALKGRHDEEAARIREAAPQRAELARLMARAGQIYRGFDMPDRAEMVEDLGRRFAGQTEGRKPQRVHEEGPDRQREKLQHALEVIGIARHGLLEVERKDLVETLDRLAHAIKISLSGRQDEEAREIMRSAPRGENVIEILLFAADKWEGFGHEQKAETIRKLAREWSATLRKERRGAEVEEAMLGARVQELQAQLAELTEMMRHLRKELEEIRREVR